MRKQSALAQFCPVAWILPACLLSGACGSAGEGSAANVLAEAPHCPSGTDALKIEGTIDDGTIDDTRTTNINAGYQNIGMPKFFTPVAGPSSLQANQIATTLSSGT